MMALLKSATLTPSGISLGAGSSPTHTRLLFFRVAAVNFSTKFMPYLLLIRPFGLHLLSKLETKSLSFLRDLYLDLFSTRYPLLFSKLETGNWKLVARHSR